MNDIKNILKKEQRADFFKKVLEDKKSMREYIQEKGTLNGYKSTYFTFAKPV